MGHGTRFLLTELNERRLKNELTDQSLTTKTADVDVRPYGHSTINS